MIRPLCRQSLARLSIVPMLVCSPWLAACGGEAPPAEPPPTVAPAPAPPAEPAPLAVDYAMPNPATPISGVLTGGQPTGEDLDKLAARGFRTVISLRPDSEPGTENERDTVEALGMRFVVVPVAGADGLTRENAEAVTKMISDPANQPLLLHCGSSNRVGALVALGAAYVDGAAPEEALALGRAAGLASLEVAVRERLGLDGE